MCLFLPASSVSHWALLFRDLLQVCFAVYLVLEFVRQRLAVRKIFSSVKVSVFPSVMCVFVNVEITPTCERERGERAKTEGGWEGGRRDE